jgi:hypothetical protein
VYLVSISGACSRSGKTAAAVSLLAAAPRGAAAVKFTTTDEVFERCPRGTPCLVCDIDVPFRIIEDPAVLSEPGTDTARLLAAGAARVVWVIAKPSAVGLAWAAARARIAAHPVVVMEGSTIVPVARPDREVFVAHPWLSPERWKATSRTCVSRADLVVVNRPAGADRAPAPAVLEALGRGAVIADVTRPAAEWAAGIVGAMPRHAREAAVPA